MFISSDTNIWLDFENIGHLDHPFYLENEYYISNITYHDELYKSKLINNIIKKKHLKITNLTIEEMNIANRLSNAYNKISFQDSLALAIAINRNWILLTGDNALRNAAKLEGIENHGTIWIYDELYLKKKLSKKEMLNVMKKLLKASENGRRLPKEEILKRIINLQNT